MVESRLGEVERGACAVKVPSAHVPAKAVQVGESEIDSQLQSKMPGSTGDRWDKPIPPEIEREGRHTTTSGHSVTDLAFMRGAIDDFRVLQYATSQLRIVEPHMVNHTQIVGLRSVVALPPLMSSVHSDDWAFDLPQIVLRHGRTVEQNRYLAAVNPSQLPDVLPRELYLYVCASLALVEDRRSWYNRPVNDVVRGAVTALML